MKPSSYLIVLFLSFFSLNCSEPNAPKSTDETIYTFRRVIYYPNSQDIRDSIFTSVRDTNFKLVKRFDPEQNILTELTSYKNQPHGKFNFYSVDTPIRVIVEKEYDYGKLINEKNYE